MTTKSWQFTSFNPGVGGISWISPLHDQSNQILAFSGTQISLIDTVTKNVLSTYRIDRLHSFLKSSKIYDGHILLTNLVSASPWVSERIDNQAGSELTIVYAQGSQIHTRVIQYQIQNLLSSRLNLGNDTWSLIESSQGDFDTDGGINSTKSARVLQRFSLSTLLAKTSNFSIPDAGDVELTDAHLFELFPSRLGYATNTTLNSGDHVTLEMFNKPYMK